MINIAHQKVLLRQKMRTQRQVLGLEFCQKTALVVAKHANVFLKRGSRLGVYWAYGSELSLLPLIQRAFYNKASVFLPQVNLLSRVLHFVQLKDVQQDPSRTYSLKKSSYRYKAICQARALDVIFVPLIAVDNQGYRLGQGGGFYDATLFFSPIALYPSKALGDWHGLRLPNGEKSSSYILGYAT